MEPEKTVAKPDWLTVVSIAVVTHALSAFIHEALGHGGTCVAVGCSPCLLTTMQFQGDEQSLPTLSVDAISAGGSVANLVAATVAVLFLKRHRGPARTGWFFLWLFATGLPPAGQWSTWAVACGTRAAAFRRPIGTRL